MLPSTLAVFLFTVTVFRGAEAGTLTARVYSGGVKGDVTFTQTSPGQNVTLNFALLGPKVADVRSWQFHTHRLNYDVSNRCTVQNLGARYLDKISGPITNGNVESLNTHAPSPHPNPLHPTPMEVTDPPLQ